MTKKHFAVFAQMFADVETDLVAPIRSEKSRAVARTVARHIQTRAADIFADDNPRFSRARFFAACTRAEKDGPDGEYYGSAMLSREQLEEVAHGIYTLTTKKEG